MMGLRWLDSVIISAYLIAVLLIGVRFARRQTTIETYFVAKRSIPSWALGISMLATIISAVTFIAYPGAGYAGNWSLLVPGIMVVVVPAIVGFVVIPFYRQAVGISTYEYFEKRFGYPARIYGSLSFALGTFSKMAFVVYLLALTIASMTSLSVSLVIVAVAALTVVYTLIGGLEAVIWADVVQGIILWGGVLGCLGYLLWHQPGGPSAAWHVAQLNHKFDMGSTSLVFSKPTIVVLSIYGFFWYLQKYTADQTMVQRYLAAKSDKAALKGVFLGAALCIPVWTFFMLLGTQLWAFYKLSGEQLPTYIAKGDQVFPYFIRTHIPPGIAGLFIAALFGAAMATLSSDLNCLALVAVEDFYRKLYPHAADQRRLRVAKYFVAGCGLLTAAFAIRLSHSLETALSLWYTISAIVAGGLAGLFLLAFLSDRANRYGCYVGIFASVVFTSWATLTLNGGKIIDLGQYNFPLHDYTIAAIGHVVLLSVGYFASFLFRNPDPSLEALTLWSWRRRSDPLNHLSLAQYGEKT